MKRKNLSKRLRFEIFKRDGFKCLYCGTTPAQNVLRVDHVTPVTEGGGDAPTNLVTSCFDCNAGKGPVPLEQRQHAAGIATEAEKEHADQIREWLKVQRDIEAAKGGVIDDLLEVWRTDIGEPEPDVRSRLRACLGRNSVQDIREAIVGVGVKRLYGSRQLKYFYGILRNLRGEKPEPEPQPPPAKQWSERALRVGRHLRAWHDKGGAHCIDDVFKEFTISAWGAPTDLGYATYTKEWEGGTECRCRGLVLRTKPAEGAKISWWVEDDTEANVALGLVCELSSLEHDAGFDLYRFFRPGEYSETPTREAVERTHSALAFAIHEAKLFLQLLVDGNEVELRSARAKQGWPCPQWRAD